MTRYAADASIAPVSGERLNGGGNIIVPGPGVQRVIAVAAGTNEWRLSGYRLEGTLTGVVASINWTDPDNASATETETAISVGDCTRYLISDFSISSFRKFGIDFNAATFTDLQGVGRAQRGIVSAGGIYNCTIGVRTKNSGGAGGNEFIIISATHIGGCRNGLDLAAGNSVLSGVIASDNFEANLRLRGGVNNGHGVAAACLFNHTNTHSGYLLHATDVTLGYLFTSCGFFANNSLGNGVVFFDESGGIQIMNSYIDCLVYNRTGSLSSFPYNRLVSCYMPGGYGFEIRNVGGAPGVDKVIVRDCFGPGAIDTTGITKNDAADFHVMAARTAPVSIVAGDTLIFDSVPVNGNRRAFASGAINYGYNPATGKTRIPPWISGLYCWSGKIIWPCSGATPSDSRIELMVNGVAVEVFTAAPLGASALVFDLGHGMNNFVSDDEIWFRAAVVGSGVTGFGSATWRSHFSLMKLA